MGTLSESIHYNPDGVMPPKSSWQMGHEIH